MLSTVSYISQHVKDLHCLVLKATKSTFNQVFVLRLQPEVNVDLCQPASRSHQVKPTWAVVLSTSVSGDRMLAGARRGGGVGGSHTGFSPRRPI